jgi:hypothetical protein
MNPRFSEIKWAFIFTATTLLWMLAEKATGLHDIHIDKHAVYRNLFAVPAILIYVFALREKRAQTHKGEINYWETLKSGIWLTFFATLFAPISQYITSTLITPDYFAYATEHAIENGNMEPEYAEEYFSMSNYIQISLIGTPIMGVLTSTVVAAFIKTK